MDSRDSYPLSNTDGDTASKTASRTPDKENANPQCREKTDSSYSYLLRVAVLLIALITSIFALNQANERSQSKRELDQYRRDSILLSEHQESLYKMHKDSFDQGYQRAVLDMHSGNPQYVITEENNPNLNQSKNPILWKRQSLPQEISKKTLETQKDLQSLGQSLSQELEKLKNP